MGPDSSEPTLMLPAHHGCSAATSHSWLRVPLGYAIAALMTPCTSKVVQDALVAQGISDGSVEGDGVLGSRVYVQLEYVGTAVVPCCVKIEVCAVLGDEVDVGVEDGLFAVDRAGEGVA